MAIVPTSSQAPRPTTYQEFAARCPEVIERLHLLRQKRDRWLAKLTGQPRREQRDEVRKLLRSGSLHFLYAYEALRAKGMLRGATEESIEALATRCNPFAPVREPIASRWVTKAGKSRQVHDFGPINRMHHLLVADVLRALHPPRQDQFLLNGGMPMALKAIETAFRGGALYAAEVDVVSFYGRVRYSGLADILYPLPPAVTDHVVWDVTRREWRDDDDTGSMEVDTPSSSGLVGLSLGAATSPVVGEIIIGRLLDTAPPGTMVTYADNILVLGQGGGEVDARTAHLREVAQGLPTGPLELRVKAPVNFCDPTDHVSFAGQWGRAMRHRLDWQPNERKQAEHLVADASSLISAEALANAESKLLHWRRSYPMWRTGDGTVVRRMAELAAVRYYHNAQPEHLADARYKLAEAYLTTPGIELVELLPEGTSERHRERRRLLMQEAQTMLDLIAARMAAA